MDAIIKINALYKELLVRGHKNFTWPKLKDALVKNDYDQLTPTERAILKKVLIEVSNKLTKTIKSL